MRLETGTADYEKAIIVAVVAIMAYPVGLILLFGCLLLCARKDIISGRQTALSDAIAFLHRDCAWQGSKCRSIRFPMR